MFTKLKFIINRKTHYNEDIKQLRTKNCLGIF